MRHTTIRRVTLNTDDVVEQSASVVFPETTEVVRPLVTALVPASDGIPRQRPMVAPFQQYTVQGLALSPAAACFRVYAPPRAPIPTRGDRLGPAGELWGGEPTQSIEVQTLWESLHGLAGETEVTLTDPARSPRPPWLGVLCHSALFRDPEAASWIGDFEQCVAWTVLKMKEPT